MSSDEDSSAAGGDDDSVPGELEEYYEVDSKLKPQDRVQYLMMLCFSYINDFTILSYPTITRHSINPRRSTRSPSASLSRKSNVGSLDSRAFPTKRQTIWCLDSEGR